MSKRDERSRRYHDRVARQYDAIYEDPYWAFHDELTWRTIKPHLPRDMSAKCADLGCGTGKWGLRLLKSGFATTFLDNSGAMIEQTREKIELLGPKGKKALLVVADICEMDALPDAGFALTLAMGDPLSICSDPQRAANEMFRICAPGGVVIATADSKLAALTHFIERGNLDALEEFVGSSKTHWLTADAREQFELTMFTPASLRQILERAGFDVIGITGKPIVNVRANRKLLESPDAINRLLKIESSLSKDPTSAAAAGHLQVIARRL